MGTGIKDKAAAWGLPEGSAGLRGARGGLLGAAESSRVTI